MVTIIFLVLFLALLPIIHLLSRNGRGSSSKRLPPGSTGIPVIGYSFSLIRAMRANTAENWIQSRINKYGPVSKLSLFGRPTVLLSGPAANKFMFTSEALGNQQTQAITRILGKRNILDLMGEDHKRVRGAIMQFLRPELLKQYVIKMDGEVRLHLDMNWVGRQSVTVLPLMKRLTFDIICSLVFGLERGPNRELIRERLVSDFTEMVDGMWAIPVNLPFTRFNRSLKATERARNEITRIIQDRRAALENGSCRPYDDLIAYMLSLGGEEGEIRVSEEEIIDNVILAMVAGHDTSSILITFMVRQLAKDPAACAAVVQEQEEISKCKAPGEALTWDDLSKMKYTWRVAMETLRMIPPVFGNFRRVLKDVEFGGYFIPKGWQVFWASSITHMDANIFPDPSKFDPLRFENQSSIPPYSFVAFGGGPRICPGNEFARLEVLVTMHYLVTQFRWKLCCEDDVFCRDPMPSPSQGLPIQLEPKSNISLLVPNPVQYAEG